MSTLIDKFIDFQAILKIGRPYFCYRFLTYYRYTVMPFCLYPIVLLYRYAIVPLCRYAVT
jgi:hypothetical protein